MLQIAASDQILQCLLTGMSMQNTVKVNIHAPVTSTTVNEFIQMKRGGGGGGGAVTNVMRTCIPTPLYIKPKYV